MKQDYYYIKIYINVGIMTIEELYSVPLQISSAKTIVFLSERLIILYISFNSTIKDE